MRTNRRTSRWLGALLLPVVALAADALSPLVPDSARTLAVGATSLSAVLSTPALAADALRPSLPLVARAVADDESTPIPIQVGETIRAELPFGDPFETEVVFELQAASAGPLTIVADSLEFWTYLEIVRTGPEWKPPFIRSSNRGAGEGDTWEVLQVETGDLFLIKVRAGATPYCGVAFEISVTEETREPIYDAEHKQAVLAHWDAAAARAKASGKPECEVRALLGRARNLPGNRAKEEALPLAREALALAEEQLGAGHPLVALGLNDLAGLLARTGSREEGLRQIERALAIHEKATGPDHVGVARILSTQAQLLAKEQQSERRKGVQALERAVAILEKRLDPEHLYLLRYLNDLAWAYAASGSLDKATVAADRAFALCERHRGPEDATYCGEALHNLALFLAGSGFPERARDLRERLLAMNQRAFKPDHSAIRSAHAYLAGSLQALGQYDEAKKHLDASLRIAEQNPDAWDGRHLTEAHNAMAGFLAEMGDYAEAEGHYEWVLDSMEKDPWGKDPFLRAWFRAMYGGFLTEVGRYAEARDLYEKSVELMAERDHWAAADSLEGFGIALHRLGDFGESRTWLERALAKREQTLDPDNPGIAHNLDSLAQLLVDMDLCDEARPLAERAVAIYTKRLGSEHRSVGESLETLAKILACQGRHAEALDAALRAATIGGEHLRLIAGSMPERLALKYASKSGSGRDLALSLLAEAPERVPGSVRAAWDTVIPSRAVIFDEVGAKNQIISEVEEIVRLVQKHRGASRRCATFRYQGAAEKESADRYRKRVDDACGEAEELQQELFAALPGISRGYDRMPLTLRDLTPNIPPTGALIAYARYERSPPSPPARTIDAGQPSSSSAGGAGDAAPGRPEAIPSYLAFVMRRGAAEPVVVPLGPAGEIDALVEDWQTEAGPGGILADRPSGDASREGSRLDHAEAAYRKAAEALRRAVWDPLQARLGDAKRLFVVADGALNLVNLSSLPAAGGGYLIEKGLLVHYLSAERDLALPEIRLERSGTLLAMGGADFNAKGVFTSTGGAVAESGRSDPAESSMDPGSIVDAATSGVTRSGPFRGDRSTCGDAVMEPFESLPASRREVWEIGSLWKEAVPSAARKARTSGIPQDPVLRLTEAAATETAFKEHAAGKQILHLATHGFFLGGRCPSALERGRGFGAIGTGSKTAEEIPAQAASEPKPAIPPPLLGGENPLILSGLALAGANNRAAAGPDEEDGILTAQEIAAMDLSGVEWAVLSACDTGVGEIRAGEGVFGLRRAFQVAGARTLIMSLWSVEDEATRQWMKALYEGRLRKNLGTAEAVREASLAVLNDRRARGESTHPFYWAGFVAAGDWR